MGMIALVRADFLKQRHTSYWGIHTVIPIAGAILFVFYFLLYQNVDELRKLRLLLELAAMGVPAFDKRYCRSEHHTGGTGLAFSKPADGARSPENTVGKVCCPVSVRYLFFDAAFYTICGRG